MARKHLFLCDDDDDGDDDDDDEEDLVRISVSMTKL